MTLSPDDARALLETHYAGLLALLRRKLRDEQLAHDMLNQALVTSLEHLRVGRIADLSQDRRVCVPGRNESIAQSPAQDG